MDFENTIFVPQPKQLKRVLFYNQETDRFSAKRLLFPEHFFVFNFNSNVLDMFYVSFCSIKQFAFQNNFFDFLPLPNINNDGYVCLSKMPGKSRRGTSLKTVMNKTIDYFWESAFDKIISITNGFHINFFRKYLFKEIFYSGLEFLKIWEENSHNLDFFDDVILPKCKRKFGNYNYNKIQVVEL